MHGKRSLICSCSCSPLRILSSPYHRSYPGATSLSKCPTDTVSYYGNISCTPCPGAQPLPPARVLYAVGDPCSAASSTDLWDLTGRFHPLRSRKLARRAQRRPGPWLCGLRVQVRQRLRAPLLATHIVGAADETALHNFSHVCPQRWLLWEHHRSCGEVHSVRRE